MHNPRLMQSGRATRLPFWGAPLALLLAFAALLSLPHLALAAGNITVDRTDDTAAASACTAAANDCSLRGAFAFANANAGATITVNAGTYTLSLGELQLGTAANHTSSIVGAGAATTIIQQTAANRRVININPTGAIANIVVSISGVTITGGTTPSDGDGGAGIIAGGQGSSLNLSNCILSNNSLGAGTILRGAGVKYVGGGVLTIDNCQFSNNTAVNVGGAVDYTLTNNAGASGQGGLSITNSSFTNNTAGAAGTGAGGAIRVAITTTQAVSAFSISNNTFTGNQASTGFGGAIDDAGSVSSTMRFNRFFNNTASSGSGIYKVNGTTGTLNATENWWGCNTGPGTTGCDSIGGQTANITVAPRLFLTHTASPSTIVVNQTSALTASFLTDSAGGAVTLANISRLIGLPITFGATLGTISGAQTTIQANGAATAIFTGNAVGAGSATGTVDNGTATANITINGAPDLTITKSHTGNFTQGQTGAQYTITVSNSGSASTSGTVTVLDTLPTGLTISSIATGAAWNCTQSTQTTLNCTTLNALAAGSSYPSITLAVNVASNAPASVINTASVSGGAETNTGNDTASDPTTINALPTSTPTFTPTPTNTPTFTPTPTNTPTFTPTPTNTPTNTPTFTPTPTNTPTNTPTFTPTPTNTPVPSTATATNTPTNTPVPSTATATDTPTNTPVPPTATATDTPTNTPVPPTATATDTPTNTPVPPTATATDTPTNTPVPPTATATNTPTNTPVPPTATATNTPTITPIPTPSCNGRTATIYVKNGKIVGGPGNGATYTGTLIGTTGNDVFVGTEGKDIVDAKAGNDVICGLGGDDQLTGDAGTDYIDGGDGNDTLKGSSDADTLIGGQGDDALDGDDGNDTLNGGIGNDFLDGDKGNDTLTGEAGADIFKGGDGTDTATDFTASQGDTKSSVEHF